MDGSTETAATGGPVVGATQTDHGQPGDSRTEGSLVGATDRAAAQTGDPGAEQARRRRPSRVMTVARRGGWSGAALFVLPYLLFMIVWAYTNPPGAAPDESDHLIKSIGIARLQIGVPYHPTTPNARAVLRRNDSISRVVGIPARLNPQGFLCTAFHPTRTAACQPTHAPAGTGLVAVRTTVGSYPPALYLPIGLAARAMTTPASAFFAGRTVCVLMATLLIFFGAAHLIRWLGRQALLGAFIGFTPIGVFASSVVSTSGVEICGAFAVACVAVVAMRRPESISKAGTQILLAVVGSALILSRQLGVVTFAGLMILMLLRIGWRPIWQLIREHRPPFLISLAVLAGSGVGIYLWERGYDHPSDTGTLFNKAAIGGFNAISFQTVKDGIGNFGWLDTPFFGWAQAAWIILAVVVIGSAALIGRGPDRWSLVGWLAATWLVAFGVYATVFYPIHVGVQGRHMLPFFMLAPVLAGVVAAERLEVLAVDAARRLFALTALVMPLLQLLGLYVNARRYAVGVHGPFLFLSSSAWHPAGGWVPWAVVAVLGAVLLVVVILTSRPRLTRGAELETARVAG